MLVDWMCVEDPFSQIQSHNYADWCLNPSNSFTHACFFTIFDTVADPDIE